MGASSHCDGLLLKFAAWAWLEITLDACARVHLFKEAGAWYTDPCLSTVCSGDTNEINWTLVLKYV